MIRHAAVVLLVLASCARPAALDPSGTPSLDPVDEYILEHLFIGSPDALSPIGERGKPIRGDGDQWVLTPVWRGRQLDPESAETKYVQHTWCYSDAIMKLLEPDSLDYDPEFEESFRRANSRANASIEPTANLGILHDQANPILLEDGIFRRLARAVDPSCPRVAAVPAEVVAGDTRVREIRGIRGQTSYLGPQEPCAIFRYCVLSEEPSLLYDVFSLPKQECFAIHEELLEEDDEYRRLYSSEMTPFLKQVADVPPDQAAMFLINLYQEMQSLEFYQQLVATYEARQPGP